MNGTESNVQPTAAPPPAGTWQPPVASATRPDPRRKTPLLASLLSVMPGLGQVYTGYYVRGFVHALVVAFCIMALANISYGNETVIGPLFGIFLAFFWLYNIIDAGRRAALYNMYLDGMEEIEPPEDFAFKMPSLGGSVFGGVVMILFGAIALSYTLFGISLAWLEDWWPVAPIALGLYLVIRSIYDRAQAGARSSDADA